ncbi:MAG TPA: protein-L-isoaspartate(D-aspartate) O-methyltransferase [Bryobacteraceae bacterium]|nr:protein-L-isoaspartate(D-aspartate) O-methyltransferase [Bryobacteraceae bacterium]
MIPDWAVERRLMVETQLRARGIRDQRVLHAMREIPREEFVSPEWRVLAYQDNPISIGYGQTVSQPYMTALMAELLELTGNETVLEVGTGCGYHAAVLGALASHVYTIELVPALARLASQNLRRTARDANITVICGDGSAGYAEKSPYDAISVAAGAPEIPVSLLAQLADPGRMVIPVGKPDDQELLVVSKRDGRTTSRVATLCRFVPLRGGEGWR